MFPYAVLAASPLLGCSSTHQKLNLLLKANTKDAGKENLTFDSKQLGTAREERGFVLPLGKAAVSPAVPAGRHVGRLPGRTGSLLRYPIPAATNEMSPWAAGPHAG